MSPGLHVSHLHKRYGSHAALTDVSLTVRPGEVLGLIGPNGAGKTTLFECVAGVLPADGGSVAVEGRNVATSERGAHLFYMPDGIAPWPSQPLGWALEFSAGFFGANPAAVAAIVDALHVGAFVSQPIGELSKGQRKRALLALAMLTPQPYMLADEPFDGLDFRQGRDVGLALRAHAAAGRTLFLSIHQLGDAARVCDRFVILNEGRSCGEGTLAELTAVAQSRGHDAVGLEEVVLALT